MTKGGNSNRITKKMQTNCNDMRKRKKNSTKIYGECYYNEAIFLQSNALIAKLMIAYYSDCCYVTIIWLAFFPKSNQIEQVLFF